MESDGVFVTSWNHNVTTPPAKFKEYLERFGVEGIEVRGRKILFRCPICGDSEKVKSKKRGFLITNMNGNGAMGCHNCGYKSSFGKFLKKENNELYRKWIQDVFVGMSLDDSVAKSNEEYSEEPEMEAEVVDYSLFLPLAKVSDSVIYRMAMMFICERKIPRKFARHFLYCQEGKYANRIIIPHYNKDMTYTHFEARDLRPRPWIKYLYPENWKPSNYNLPHLDLGDDYFVFEGVIDSLFMDNSAACGGAQKYDFFFENVHRSNHRKGIIFADGDEDGIRVAHKFMKKGFRVVKWTREMMTFKKGVHDLNGLIQHGFFKPDDFNADGTIKKEVIMQYVVEPTIGEILSFHLEALNYGINVLERKQRVEFTREESKPNWFAW